MDENEIKSIVHKLVRNLVNKDYLAIYEEDNRKLLTADLIEEAIIEYPGNITMPPENAFDSIDIYRISTNEVAIDFDLWYDNKKSDLTLSARLLKVDSINQYSIEGIHIL